MMRVLFPFAALTVAVAVLACERTEVAAAGEAAENERYALYFERVLELASEWLGGGPHPTTYCVAVAPGYDAPDFERGRDPDTLLIASLHERIPGRDFRPAGTCSPGWPWTGPTGDPAGLLWVTPLNPDDREHLSGGWYGFPGDAAGWGCRFTEADGAVELETCEEWWEV